jgi:preprotein translocase subunit SecD
LLFLVFSRCRLMNRESRRGPESYMTRLIQMTAIFVILSACLGQASASFRPVQSKVEIRRAQSNPGAGLIEITGSYKGEKLYMSPDAILTNQDILEAHLVDLSAITALSPYGVSLTFTKEGAERMLKIGPMPGDAMVILIDGQVVLTPTLQEKVHDKVEISGEFSKEQAERIINALTHKPQ